MAAKTYRAPAASVSTGHRLTRPQRDLKQVGHKTRIAFDLVELVVNRTQLKMFLSFEAASIHQLDVD